MILSSLRTYKSLCMFYCNRIQVASKLHHLFKSYDKSADQPQECHETTQIQDLPISASSSRLPDSLNIFPWLSTFHEFKPSLSADNMWFIWITFSGMMIITNMSERHTDIFVMTWCLWIHCKHQTGTCRVSLQYYCIIGKYSIIGKYNIYMY